MPSILPTIPYTVFAVVEPISLLGGAAAAFFNTAYFVAEQAPQSRVQAMLPLSNNTRLIALMLGNLFVLMAAMAVVLLHTTTQRAVVRGYLMVLGAADLSHIGLSLYFMGPELVRDPSRWTPVAWGNTAFTLFLFTTGMLYLTGIIDNAPKGKTVGASKKSS